MDKLTIYIDRLKGGHTAHIKETLPPSFLEINEKELAFPEEVYLSGDVYLTDDHLVGHLHIQTTATIPCSICNHPVKIPIDIRDHYVTEPLSEIRGAIYDISQETREAILLQVPQFTECNQGNCPERDALEPFLQKTSDENKSPSAQTVHFPFADLD